MDKKSLDALLLFTEENVDDSLRNDLEAVFKLSRDGLRAPITLRFTGRSNNKGLSLTMNVLEFDSVKIANELTMTEFEAYCNIMPYEFMNQSWQKPDKDLRAPNLGRTIQRLNKVCYWFATLITKAPTDDLKIAHIQKFLDVAKNLKELKNFNSMMEIMAGLNNSAVYRLKKLWNAIPIESKQIFSEIEQLMSSMNNFATYRTFLENQTPPVFPYLALILRDITFIHDGNGMYIGDCMNMQFLQLIFKQVQTLQKYQSKPYELETDDLIHKYLHENMGYVDEDKLYEWSLKYQPAGSLNPNGNVYDPNNIPD